MGRIRQQDERGQFTLVAMVLALVVVGVLTALAAGAFTGSTTSGAPGSGSGGAVGTAEDVQAENTLSTAVQIAGQAGTYGALSPSVMASSGGAGITYVSSGSTSPSTVSIASTGGITGGSAMMAVFATGGTCWFAWLGSGGPYYGAQTGQSSCLAVAMPSTPVPGAAPSSTAIGWKYNGYPNL